MYKLMHLVSRDLLVQKRQRTLVLPALLSITSAIVLPKAPTFAVGTIIMASYFIVVYVNAYDFKYNAELGYRSLPISRASLVVARYLGVVVFALASLAISITASTIFQAVGLFEVDYGWTLPLVGLAFCTLSLYYAVFFPVYFKLGYMKSRWANYILLIVLYGGLGSVRSVGSTDVRLTAPVLSDMFSAPYSAVAVVLCLGAFLLSMALSISLERSREL
jgi:hypothetical protein